VKKAASFDTASFRLRALSAGLQKARLDQEGIPFNWRPNFDTVHRQNPFGSNRFTGNRAMDTRSGQLGYPYRPGSLPGFSLARGFGLMKSAYHLLTRRPEGKKATFECSLSACFSWCPQSESNQRLMITNQLHDLHATGASCF
jgi:hypothetical protein